MDLSQHFKGGWYYGVANKKDNFSRVIEDYPAAQAMVEQVPGASWKTFPSREEVSRFVETHRRDLHMRSPGQGPKNDFNFLEPGNKEGHTQMEVGRVELSQPVRLPMSQHAPHHPVLTIN